ncbi:MAG TPA: imelysin family protein [Streptosporangiaceae bacterium]
MRTTGLLAIAACAASVATLAACSSGSGQQAGVVTVSNNQCGSSWQLPRPGWHTFKVNNQGTNGAEIDLLDPANGAVYAEIESSGPGTTTPMSLKVGSGKYAFLCLFADSDPDQGPTVTVAGHVAGTRPILPVTYNDLYPLSKQYQAETEAGLKVLAPETAALAAAVRDGNLAAARRDWLTAHLQYETLGDAYGAFGTFDDEIDGRADALGVNNPQWTGFYRLEYGLWHDQSLQSLTPVASTLNTDVGKLVVWWKTQQVPLTDIGRRTHEVLENALEFQLTGHDDYGSGTTLATTVANIQATRALLALLDPLLTPRYPGLAAVKSGLAQLQALLLKERQSNGSWIPVAKLATQTRQEIDAACGQLLQELAPIASITEPRNTARGF